MMRVMGAVALASVLASGCGGGEKQTKEMTERQRDSVIATEKALPGSDVVGRALATSDSAAAQAKRTDQQVQQGAEGGSEGK